MTKDGAWLVVGAAVRFSMRNSNCDTGGDADVMRQSSQRLRKADRCSYHDPHLKTVSMFAGEKVTCHISINDSAGLAPWYSSQKDQHVYNRELCL